MTIGSPLTLRTVQASLGPPLSKLSGIVRWLNAVDPDDFVALGRGLDESIFSGGVENLVDVVHTSGDAHALETYLGDRRVAEAIAGACA